MGKKKRKQTSKNSFPSSQSLTNEETTSDSTHAPSFDPMTRFPLEIIYPIFLYVPSSSYLPLTRVSKTWQTTLLSIPNLWRDIVLTEDHIPFPNPQNYEEKVRMKERLVDKSFQLSTHVLALLKKTQGKLRSLKLDCPNSLMDDVLKSIQDWCIHQKRLVHWSGFALENARWITSEGLSNFLRAIIPCTNLNGNKNPSINLRHFSFYQSGRILEKRLFAQLPSNLRALDISGCIPVHEDYFKTSFPYLHTLNLLGCSIDDELFERIVHACPNVEVLNLYIHRNLTVKGFQSILKLHQLRDLHFSQLIPSEEANFMDILKAWKQPMQRWIMVMENECVSRANIFPNFLQISKSTLRVLSIPGSKNLNSTDYFAIHHCKLLTELEVNACPNFTPEVLSMILPCCPQLRKLNISHIQHLTTKDFHLFLIHTLHLHTLIAKKIQIDDPENIFKLIASPLRWKILDLSECREISEEKLSEAHSLFLKLHPKAEWISSLFDAKGLERPPFPLF